MTQDFNDELETPDWTEAIRTSLLTYGRKTYLYTNTAEQSRLLGEASDEAVGAINQAVKDHIIADILGMCLETKRPGEFPSVDALMIRDKIVLKYLVTKGNE